MTTVTVKIVFYLPGSYTLYSLEYAIPRTTFARLDGEYKRYWKYPEAKWIPLSQTQTFNHLFGPILHKLHATNIYAYAVNDTAYGNQ